MAVPAAATTAEERAVVAREATREAAVRLAVGRAMVGPVVGWAAEVVVVLTRGRWRWRR